MVSVDDSEQESNVFSLASRFPLSGLDRKISRIEPVPRAYPWSRLEQSDWQKTAFERKRAEYTAIYVNEDQTNIDEPIYIFFNFDVLYWLLEDYKNPDHFANKLAIRPESFVDCLNDETPRLCVEFVENIAIAIQRIENSKDFQSKWRQILTAECIENFIIHSVVQLYLTSELSSVTIDLLKACNVFHQNCMFQTFLRVIVHAAETTKDTSETGADLSQMEPSSAAIPNYSEEREIYEQIYNSEDQTKKDGRSAISFHFLMWLLEDFQEPEEFYKKIMITPSPLLFRLEEFGQPQMAREFVENIAIAIWRMENCKNYMNEWHGNIYYCMKLFVLNHVARLLLKNQLSPETIRILKGCRLIREHRYFRRLIGLPPLIDDGSSDYCPDSDDSDI